MEGDIELNPFRRRLRKNGVGADARIMEALGRTRFQNTSSSMSRRYVVEVQPEGEPAFQVTLKDNFSAGWAPKRGDLLRVKYSPKTHKVVFDLAGDPRFNPSMQQMTGQWKPGEEGPPSPFGTGSRGEVLPPD
jgi:hypothetical protein